MIKEIVHVGITVSNMDESLKFYQDILDLKLVGEIMMEGKESDLLFGRSGVKARVCYLNGSDKINTPPVELICFLDEESKKDPASLFKTSISEICFNVEDIDQTYKTLIENHVECLSEPQYFDFTPFGFSKSKALYFKDPDGIILELIQTL